ncbi:MAG: hypothetical protein Kow0042_07010 [Calditrichia bacterium]
MSSSKYSKLTPQGVKRYSIKNRFSKVNMNDFSSPATGSDTIRQWIEKLPDILVGRDFKEFVDLYKRAVREKNFIIWMMGAHVIKCGLNPILIDLMAKGYISHLALNGAGAIHDVEVAMWGVTSEDVAAGLDDGTFGMAEETADFINGALTQNRNNPKGYAEAIAEKLIQHNPQNLNMSLLASAYRYNIPISLHPALGTEIVHQHPNLDGQAFGEKSLLDFEVFTHSLAQLKAGSIVINAGSAVILPEVFLKALTIVRNLGYPAFGFYTAVFDMIRHYRPMVNVMQRPTQKSGKGYYFIGHHEIMIPLLAAAIQ